MGPNDKTEEEIVVDDPLRQDFPEPEPWQLTENPLSDFPQGRRKTNSPESQTVSSFDLKNVGAFDGAEIVQLYVGDTVSTVVRPIKELKKFEKVFCKQFTN